jgi:hypothetical protein
VLLLGEELAIAGSWEPRPAPPFSRSIARWVQAHGQPLHLLDPSAEERFSLANSVQALGHHTVDAVPVRHAGATLGVLYSDHARVEELPADGLAGLARLGELVGAWLGRR